MKYWKLLATLAVAFGAVGCATVDGIREGLKQDLAGPAKKPEAQEVIAMTPPPQCGGAVDADCIRFEIDAGIFDPQHPVTRGLDQQSTTIEERARRVNEVPAQIHSELAAGRLQSAGSRSYYAYVFQDARIAHAAGYHKSKVGRFEAAPVVKYVKPRNLPVLKDRQTTGAPQVFRVQSRGEPVSFQFAKIDLQPSTAVLLCPQDGKSVFPGNLKGMWLTAAFLSMVKERGWKHVKIAFLFERGNRPAPMARPPERRQVKFFSDDPADDEYMMIDPEAMQIAPDDSNVLTFTEPGTDWKMVVTGH